MDLLFRSMSRAAGVEIPPDRYFPWETLQKENPRAPRLLRRTAARTATAARRIFGRGLGLLGTRLVRAGEALASG